MRTAEQNAAAQIAYDTAYFVLPRRAHAELEELRSEFAESPDVWALFYFMEAAKGRGVRPNAELIRTTRGHTGRLDSRHEFIVIEYPLLSTVDLLADLSGGLPTGHILAPYFSAVVIDRDSDEARCYVLGQSPDARTTLRLVSPELNANLGPGCEPNLDTFLKLLRRKTGR